MARGVDGMGIFLDDRDYGKFLGTLNRLKREAGMVIYAYCLMPNHFHLAIKVSTVPLSSFMHRILTGHALTFNQRYDRLGHLFQARHKAKLCLNDRYLLGLIRYIQMNPVRAGLVSRPEDWSWSSRTPIELPNMGTDEFDPWPKEDAPPALIRLPPPSRSSIEDIGSEVCSTAGVGLGELKSGSKCRKVVDAKIRLSRECAERGIRLSEIARWLNVPVQSISYYLKKNSENCDA